MEMRVSTFLRVIPELLLTSTLSATYVIDFETLAI